MIGEEDDVSVYDIADHPDFHFRTTDIIIRIGNSGTEDCGTEVQKIGFQRKLRRETCLPHCQCPFNIE